jgi:flagellar protein FliL
MSDAPEEKAPAKGGRMKLIAAGVVALLLGGGGGAGAMYFLGGSPEPPKVAEGEEGHGEEGAAEGEEGGHGEAPAEGGHGEAPAEGGHGAPAEGGHGGGGGDPAKPALPVLRGNRSVVNLGTFTVNLRGSGGGRVLRTEVQVEVAARDADTVDTYKPVLRDAVIALASDFTYADLEGIDGKTHLRDELLGRLNTVLEGKPAVDRLYFTEFVVQ